MNLKTLTPALALLALASLSPAFAAPPAQADAEATKTTVRDIRNVGTAMWTWYKETMAPKRSEAAHQQAEADSKATSVSMADVPVISREDLRKILVPKYIAEIPEKDGWGHPYEFHLETRNPEATMAMGLRSAGRDGRFSGDTYEVGAFSPAEFDQDIPWMDGYFVRWPEAKQ
ncbi:MAG: hypothetical protein ACJ75H_15750 [Thermoanaerobaculia bacterium]